MPFGSAIPSAAGRASIVSDNLMQTPFTLLTVGRRELPELNHLRIGMLRSLAGGAETVQSRYPGVEITMYGTMDESVRALRAGKVDALLHNSYVWSYVLQKPAYENLAVQPSAMFTMDFRAGTQNTPAGISSKRGCPAISARTGRPVTTVSRPRRYSTVSGNVMATADA